VLGLGAGALLGGAEKEGGKWCQFGLITSARRIRREGLHNMTGHVANGKTNLIGFISAILVLLTVSACASDSEDTYIAREVESLYSVASGFLDDGLYPQAAVFFDEVERQHPYSSWARRAMLMSAYSYYKAGAYDDAILASERFLTLHPGNTSAPYAHYLIAVSHYEQITDVGRDQRITEQAMAALENVVTRYPDTEFSQDASLKLDLTRDHLAGKELDVGRFYQGQGQYLAGIGRFRNVIERFQTTSHTPEALHRLVESYLSIGLEDEATKDAAVLGYNFPDSKWHGYSYILLSGRVLDPAAVEELSKEGCLGRLSGKVF